MPLAAAHRPDWSRIETVLLDLDGTLLDLAFDTYLWRERVPALYAASRSLSAEEARAALAPRFRAAEGTLDWYCIEYWTRELGLDVAALHRSESDRIAWLPGAEDFLSGLRAAGKRLVLVTNAHPETLRIKDARTGFSGYFDAAFSSHEFGAPKESPGFWSGVQAVEPFDRNRTLFVDDSAPVLRAARAAGIQWIYAIARPDSSGLAREHPGFTSADFICELAPVAEA